MSNPDKRYARKTCYTCMHSGPLDGGFNFSCAKHGWEVLPYEMCDNWTLHLTSRHKPRITVTAVFHCSKCDRQVSFDASITQERTDTEPWVYADQRLCPCGVTYQLQSKAEVQGPLC